jgi:flagellar hook-length control protein FliK
VPGATATVGAADTVAPADLSRVAEAFPPPLPGPVQPATVPPTGIAIVASSIVEAAADAVTDDSLAQTRIPQIVQAQAAAGSPSVPQTGPSLPLAKVSGATRTAPVAATKPMVGFRAPHSADPIAETRAALLPGARPTSRAPANHGPLSTTAPTQVGSPPTASESPMTATLSGHDTADGATITTSAQPSPPIAIDAAAIATPSSALSPPAVAAPEDLLPASRPASPAAQMAPVLVSLGHMSDGTQRLTMRLDPPELGRVQVSIDRPAGAPARVEITVEKIETLTLLLRDQPQLQHALDQAGVPAEGRSVTFHIASPEPAPRSEPLPAPMPGVAAGGPNGEGSHGAPRNGGQPDRHHTGTPDAGDTGLTTVTPPGWARGGLDITA